MADVALAILWHQHQPYYPDDVAGENPMPWVRMHGVKDYYGMALHLLEIPEMRCTINLVPSLVRQILQYTDQGASDRLLDLSRIPASGLSGDQALNVLNDFFMANAERMILPYPRYAELYHRRNLGRNTAQEALKRFNDRDLRDLQVWFNLTWIHPIAFDRDPDLRELLRKGRHFTEDDKRLVLDKHLEILRQVLPLHARLQASGQVELTTTPYYHPILPLLIDKRLAREAMPEVTLPRCLASYAEDAEEHVRRAVAQHRAVFGEAPRGVWPAEGSVCQSMIPLLARHGLKWLATDEEILSHSTNHFVGRDAKGHVRNPEHLYRSYRVREHDAEMSIVFRDHALSDLIGFHYQRSDGEPAALDFLGKVNAIGEAISGHEPALVSVILDGENCWEHYEGGGVAFLRALYRHACGQRRVRPVRLGEFLQEHPPTSTLPRLFAGSWISHNFDIWIGHEEDNVAWDLLHQTREHLKERQALGLAAPQTLAQAWEEIYVAEGSDWFWWYGPHHSSPQDGLFDYLFRKHLQNVYLLLGEAPPPELARPINRRAHREIYSMPRSFLEVRVDGVPRPIEWMGAGKYVAQNERGTMAMASPGAFKEVYFGFNPDALLVRVDFEDNALDLLAGFDQVRVGFVAPQGCELLIDQPARADRRVRFLRRGKETPTEGVTVGVGGVLEIALPFDLLGAQVDDPVQFYVELLEGSQSRDRAPRDATINLTRPSIDFERIMWDV